jgi:hypothetical protein
MVENVEDLAKETVIVHVSEIFRKQLTKGEWDNGILFFMKFLDTIEETVPTKYIEKLFSIVSKYPQYMYAEELEKVTFPQFQNPFLHSGAGYYAILATRKGKVLSHEKFIGYLFYMFEKVSALIGIWPLENRYHIKDLSNIEIKNRVIKELKLLTKPKLWQSVVVLTPKD